MVTPAGIPQQRLSNHAEKSQPTNQKMGGGLVGGKGKWPKKWNANVELEANGIRRLGPETTSKNPATPPVAYMHTWQFGEICFA